MPWVIARLAEPSTWVGIGLVANSVAQGLPAILSDASHGNWAGVLTVIGGVVGMIMSEKK